VCLTLYLPGTTAHLAFCRMAVITQLISASSCSASLFGASWSPIATKLCTLKPTLLLYYEPILALQLTAHMHDGKHQLP
jgi:hypothetical protein